MRGLNSTTQFVDSNLRSRLEGGGISKDLPTLEPRVEGRNETRNLPCGGLVLVLVILTSRFEATRGLFWDGPRNFEPRSDDEDDT
ncbi:hypothetical protein AVEN_177494-1 [Araneus ventricosus]|uniref:Uncharacterized protein n=1 Tax=Araneus ventricosus TaxID=182803 RepID=A0A4Y2D280_ARAVE|nr:hypothetical protein AVEN_177494-1 [Araneus ventricosus]